MLHQLHLQNYRCFNDCTFTFGEATVVVGKNNAGKSTLVEALELVSTVVNRKSATFAYPPNWLDVPKFSRGIAPSISHLGLDLTTVFHRYGDPPAKIIATFGKGVTVTLYIGEEQALYATIQVKSDWVRSSGQFTALSLPWLYVLPQVGPLVSNESMLTNDYIRQNLYTRLSSRHFRNQLWRSPQSFPDFKALAEGTWHGLRLQKVERSTTREGTTLSMLVRDGDFVSEAAWMGHGLQMWLQTIWFVSRTTPNSTVVLDEPDVYMHPDLQRKLFRLLRGRFAQCIVATHSVEIMAEADPSEILVVDKSQRRSRFAGGAYVLTYFVGMYAPLADRALHRGFLHALRRTPHLSRSGW